MRANLEKALHRRWINLMIDATGRFLDTRTDADYRAMVAAASGRESVERRYRHYRTVPIEGGDMVQKLRPNKPEQSTKG